MATDNIVPVTLRRIDGRVAHLEAHGNGDHAFGWSHLEHVELWHSQRCGLAG
jgi:hypothetical protein